MKKIIYYVGKHQALGAYEVEEGRADRLLELPEWNGDPGDEVKSKEAKFKPEELPKVGWLKKDTIKWAKGHGLKIDKDRKEVEILEEIYAHFGYRYEG